MPRLFSKLLCSFYKLPILTPRVFKLFPRLLRLFSSLHVFFLGHRMSRLYCKPLRLSHKFFISCMGSLVHWLPMHFLMHLGV
jgi:hypothetical protein